MSNIYCAKFLTLFCLVVVVAHFFVTPVFASDACALADITGDKKVNIIDYSALVTAFGDPSNELADITQDGQVNIFDYTALVTKFGNACAFEGPCVGVGEQVDAFRKYFCQDTTNPIQEAISYAKQKEYPVVQLEPGTFTLKEATTAPLPHTIPVGLYLPQGIHLTGSTDVGQPSIITADANTPAIDILLYAGASNADYTQTLTQAELSYITFDGQKTSTDKIPLALWVGQTEGSFNIHHNTIRNFSLSGMSLGFFAQFQDSGDGVHGTLYPFNGLPSQPNIIEHNTISNVGGDGIGITGSHNLVQHNTIEGASTQGVSSGVSLFINSNNNIVTNNLISNGFVGVGLDGSFPKYITDPNNVQAQLDEAGKGNEEGFTFNNVISQNTITDCEAGVSLWRSHSVQVEGNTVTNTDIGVKIVESRDNEVYSNTFQVTNTGLFFRALEHSLVGSSDNRIGGAGDASIGNEFSGESSPLVFDGVPEKMNANIFEQNVFSTDCSFQFSTDSSGQNNTPFSCNI